MGLEKFFIPVLNTWFFFKKHFIIILVYVVIIMVGLWKLYDTVWFCVLMIINTINRCPDIVTLYGRNNNYLILQK